jgi:hypothetical protein
MIDDIDDDDDDDLFLFSSPSVTRSTHHILDFIARIFLVRSANHEVHHYVGYLCYYYYYYYSCWVPLVPEVVAQHPVLEKPQHMLIP